MVVVALVEPGEEEEVPVVEVVVVGVVAVEFEEEVVAGVVVVEPAVLAQEVV
mgnify:CR=1 FL=1